MTTTRAALDPIDTRLLVELCKDARISHLRLSEVVGLSPTSCARRIGSLEQSGIIAGYHTQLHLRKLDLGTTVIVRITLDAQNEEALEAFEKAVLQCSSIVSCFLMSGASDYVVTVVARDIEDFERIHKTQLSSLPRVARLESSFAIREVINRAVPPVALQSQSNKPRSRV